MGGLFKTLALALIFVQPAVKAQDPSASPDRPDRAAEGRRLLDGIDRANLIRDANDEQLLGCYIGVWVVTPFLPVFIDLQG